MVRPGAPKLLISSLLFFLSLLRYYRYYHILMLSLGCSLFVNNVSQSSTSYPRARFAFVLLRYVHDKEV